MIEEAIEKEVSEREIKGIIRSMRKEKAIRMERFGAVLYNKNKLRHAYVGETMADILSKDEEIEVWESNLDGLPEGLLSAPIRVYYELTRDCNLRCKQCFNNSGKPLEDEQDTGQVLATLQGLRADGVFDVRFTGGELTQRADWFEILNAAKVLGFAVSCNTNGVYREDSTIERLASLGIAQITTSIDGNEFTHNMLRGRGTYARTVDTLRKGKELGARMRINSLLFEETADHIDEVLKLASETCDEVNFFYARPFGRAREIGLHFIEKERLNEVNAYLESQRGKYEGLRILHGVQVIQDNSVRDDNFGLRLGGPDGFTRFNINSNGTMWAGGYTEHISDGWCLGNIEQEGYTLQRVWRSSPRLKMMRRISESQQKICNRCDERYKSCGGFDMEMVLSGDGRYCRE